jgi:predicted phage-related endonuclease
MMIDPSSPAWVAARVGRLTGSRFGDAIAKQKNGKWAASRENLLFDLLAERLTGVAKDHFVTPAMEWGLLNESPAVELLEVRTGILFDKAGFCLHPTIEHFGATPDRFIGIDGVLEVKCPTTKTHLQYLMNKTVPVEYQPQMMAEIVCTGRKWARFASFDPRMPPNQQLFVIDFNPRAEELQEAEQLARDFLAELDAMFERITLEAA